MSVWDSARAELNAELDSRYATYSSQSYEEISAQYKHTYGKGWIGALALDISGATSKKDKSYLAARRQIERVDKGHRGEGGAIIKHIGKKYEGRTLKGNSITITIHGQQDVYNSKHKKIGTRERSHTITLTGKVARDFVKRPSLQAFWESWVNFEELDEDYGLYGITFT